METKEWFEYWFNSPYYHILYKNRDDNEASGFLSNLIRLLRPEKNASFIDLACGKGRHAIYLNKRGYKVTGLDISENSIKEAKKHENNTLKFRVHDMRNPYKAQAEYVLNLFTSFGYFNNKNEEKEAFKNMRQMLNKNGKVVVDYLNPNYVANTMVSEEIKNVDGIEFHLSRKLKNDFIIKTIRFEHLNTQHTFEERVRAIYAEEFEKLFLATGFQIINTFGDYNLAPFSKTNSPRYIVYAKSDE
ncbi:MAG: class I SAM-dependent methyltransferase [Flavobacteriales bacterium]